MKLFVEKKKNLLLVVILVLFILFLNFFQADIKNFFYIISEPIQKILWQAGKKTSDFFELISGIKNLKRENEELKIKNNELLAEIASLKELKKENEFLREALEIDLEKEFNLVLAQIIKKDIYQDTILINKGLRDGVSEGFPVITSQKILIGKIAKVYNNFSDVILISNKESSISVKVVSKDIFGIVKGKGNSKIFLDLIPKDSEIEKEDLVITTPLNGIFPKGLLVGPIKEIRISDVKPFQEADLEIPFELKNLNNLFIIKSF